MSDDLVEQRDTLDAMLQAKRREIADKAERNLYLEVPGYQGLLWIKYKRLEWEAVNSIASTAAKRAGKNTTAELDAACDLMIRACAGIYVRRESDAKFEQYAAGFDVELAEKLAIDATKARDVVRQVFADDYKLVEQNNELLEWLRGANAEDIQRFEGE